MHKRYIYCIRNYAYHGLLGCMGLALWVAIHSPHSQAQPTLPLGLHAQAQAHVVRAMDERLSAQQRQMLHREIAVMAPRGAALAPCNSPWQWDPIRLDHWQRVHLGMRCEGRRGSVVAVIHASAPVWVTAQDLPKGHRLQPSDLHRHTARVQRLQDMPDAGALIPMQLRQALPAGTPVRLHHVERAIYARKGQPLEIRASVQGITVSVEGIAGRTAYQGETLQVRNLRSQQWVTGRLIAPGVLEASDAPSGGVTVQLQSSD